MIDPPAIVVPLLAVKVSKSNVPASIYILPDVFDDEFKDGKFPTRVFVNPPLILKYP